MVSANQMQADISTMALSLSVGREDNVAFIDATVLFMAFLRTATSETELARATSLIPVNWAMV